MCTTDNNHLDLIGLLLQDYKTDNALVCFSCANEPWIPDLTWLLTCMVLAINSTCPLDTAITPDEFSQDSPWSPMALGCKSSPPPQSWSGLPVTRCHPMCSCQCWSPCCHTPCCTCSWASSPWCAARAREAWETSGAGLLSLCGRGKQGAVRICGAFRFMTRL